MGCGCAGVERAALTIAAAGGGAKILGPQRNHAVRCDGAALTLQGLAVEAGGEDYEAISAISSSIYDGENYDAVVCTSEGRAELAGCALSSPEGYGLVVRDGATAEVQGGSIADCWHGVYCQHSGSKATVRTARPRTAATPR